MSYSGFFCLCNLICDSNCLFNSDEEENKAAPAKGKKSAKEEEDSDEEDSDEEESGMTHVWICV